MSSSATPPISYKDAGVDIDAGDALVERIKPLAKKTMNVPATMIYPATKAAAAGMPEAASRGASPADKGISGARRNW